MRQGRFITAAAAAVATLAIGPGAALATPGSFTDDSAGDFAAGTIPASAWTVEPGSVALKGTSVADNFDGTTLGAPPVGLHPWTVTSWDAMAPGSATVASGSLNVNGAHVNDDVAHGDYATGKVMEFRATFAAVPFQHIGLGDTFAEAPWAMFSTGNGTDLPTGLYARTRADRRNAAGHQTPPSPSTRSCRTSTASSGPPARSSSTSTAPSSRHTTSRSTPMRPVISDAVTDTASVKVDWLNMWEIAAPPATRSPRASSTRARDEPHLGDADRGGFAPDGRPSRPVPATRRRPTPAGRRSRRWSTGRSRARPAGATSSTAPRSPAPRPPWTASPQLRHRFGLAGRRRWLGQRRRRRAVGRQRRRHAGRRQQRRHHRQDQAQGHARRGDAVGDQAGRRLVHPRLPDDREELHHHAQAQERHEDRRQQDVHRQGRQVQGGQLVLNKDARTAAQASTAASRCPAYQGHGRRRKHADDDQGDDDSPGRRLTQPPGRAAATPPRPVRDAGVGSIHHARRALAARVAFLHPRRKTRRAADVVQRRRSRRRRHAARQCDAARTWHTSDLGSDSRHSARRRVGGHGLGIGLRR